jgi:hypothetical protein
LDGQTVDVAESIQLDKSGERRPRLSRGNLTLFAVLSLMAGVVLLLVVRLPRAIASLNWPATQGIVIASKVEASGFSTDESRVPSVSYRYSVNGKEYVSSAIEVVVVGNGNTDSSARQVVERYPRGKQVEVHYDPGDPARAYLEPGFPNNDIFVSLLFIAGVGMGFLLLCAGASSLLLLARWPR